MPSSLKIEDEVFSEEEILRILEEPNAELYPVAFLAEKLSENKVLYDKIYKLLLYRTLPSKESKDLVLSLKVSYSPEDSPSDFVKGKVEADFLVAVANCLRINEEQTVYLWNEFTKKNKIDIKSLNDSYFTSLNSLLQLHNFNMTQSQLCWNILQELLRIESDTNHVYNDLAVAYIDSLVGSGIWKNLLESIKQLYSWKYTVPKEEDLAHFHVTTTEYISFRSDYLYNECDFILKETERSLDTLILFIYHRIEMDIKVLNTLLAICVDAKFSSCSEATSFIQQYIVQYSGYHPSGYKQSSSQSSSNASVGAGIAKALLQHTRCMAFKWLVIFVDTFQFWRVFDVHSCQNQYRAMSSPGASISARSGPTNADSSNIAASGVVAIVSSPSLIHALVSKDEFDESIFNSIHNLVKKCSIESTGSDKNNSTSANGTNLDTNTNTIGPGMVLALLWGLFLNLFSSAHDSEGRSNGNGNAKFIEWVGQRHHGIISRACADGAIQYFEWLCQEVIPTPAAPAHALATSPSDVSRNSNHNDNDVNSDSYTTRGNRERDNKTSKRHTFISSSKDTGTDRIVYCLILQEYLNALLRVTLFNQKTSNVQQYRQGKRNHGVLTLQSDKFLTIISTMVSFIKMIYANQGDVCESFWRLWNVFLANENIDEIPPNALYPMCYLVSILHEYATCSPEYLLCILESLVYDSESSLQVVVMFTKQISTRYWIPISDIECITELQSQRSNKSYENSSNVTRNKEAKKTKTIIKYGDDIDMAYAHHLIEMSSSCHLQIKLKSNSSFSQRNEVSNGRLLPHIGGMQSNLNRNVDDDSSMVVIEGCKDQEKSILVSWNDGSWTTWMYVAMDLLMKDSRGRGGDVSQGTWKAIAVDTVYDKNLWYSMKCFTTIFHYGQTAALTACSKHWEQLCLFNYLQKCQFSTDVTSKIFHEVYIQYGNHQLKQPNVTFYEFLVKEDSKFLSDIVFEICHRSNLNIVNLMLPKLIESQIPPFINIISDHAILLLTSELTSNFSIKLQSQSTVSTWRYHVVSCIQLICNLIITSPPTSTYVIRKLMLSLENIHLGNNMINSNAVDSGHKWITVLQFITHSCDAPMYNFDITVQFLILVHVIIKKIFSPIPPQVESVHELFTVMDASGNGLISRNEFVLGMKHLGYDVSISVVDMLFQKITLHNGSTHDNTSIGFTDLIKYLDADENSSDNSFVAAGDTNYIKDGNRKKRILNDVEMAENELKNLLNNLISPEGLNRKMISESIQKCVTIYCLDILNHSDERWRYSDVSRGGSFSLIKKSLQLSCMEILNDIMNGSIPTHMNTNKTTVEDNLLSNENIIIKIVLQTFIENKEFQRMLLSNIFSFSVIASRHNEMRDRYNKEISSNGVSQGNGRTMKGIINASIEYRNVLSIGALPSLPVDYSNISHYGDMNENISLLEEISYQSITFLLNLLNVTNVIGKNAPQDINDANYDHQLINDAYFKIKQLLHSKVNEFDDLCAPHHPTPAKSSTLNVNAESSGVYDNGVFSYKRITCTYFTLLCGLVDYPYGASSIMYQPRSSHLPDLSMQLINNMIRYCACISHRYHFAFDDKNGVSKMFIDGIGIQNIPFFCKSICLALQSNLESDERKETILNLLLTLSTYEPSSLVHLFHVREEDNRNSDGDSRGVGDSGSNSTSIWESLQSKISRSHSDSLDNNLLMKTLIGMIYRIEDLMDKSPQLIIIINKLLCSLFDQSAAIHGIGRILLCFCLKKTFWEKITYPLTLDIPHITLLSEISDSNGNKIRNHCYILQVHASVLHILTSERFGTLFYVKDKFASEYSLGSDGSKNQPNPLSVFDLAERVEHIVNQFFERCNQSHRFVSWVRHYMIVDIDNELMQKCGELAKKLGLSLSKLVMPSNDQSMSQFGNNYVYDVNTVIRMGKNHAIGEKVRSNIIGENAWKNFINHLSHLNCMLSVVDSQVFLLRSWKRFIEIYIQPHVNRPSAYIDRQRGDSTSHTTREVSLGGDSPVFSGAGASPSQHKSSSFVGDKRSYEIVSEIAKHISSHKKDSSAWHSKRDQPGTGSINNEEERRIIKLGNENCMDDESKYLEAVVIQEKCDLFVSMLHHQLREISLRTSDPSQSHVQFRDTGSLRLTVSKMIALIELIESTIKDISQSLHVSPPIFSNAQLYYSNQQFWGQLKQKIFLRLLTAELLLYRSLASNGVLCSDVRNIEDYSNSSNNSNSSTAGAYDTPEIFQKSFLTIGDILQNELMLSSNSNDMTIFDKCFEDNEGSGHNMSSPISNREVNWKGCLMYQKGMRFYTTYSATSGSDQKHSNKSDQKQQEQQHSYTHLFVGNSLLQICLRLLKCVTPFDVDMLRANQTYAWRRLLNSSGISTILICMIRKISSASNTKSISIHYSYENWKQMSCRDNSNDGSGSVTGPPPSSVQSSSRVGDLNSISTLLNIYDYLLHNNNLFSHGSMLENLIRDGLVDSLLQSPLLIEYQYVVSQSTVSNISAYMPYDAVTGERSLISVVWTKTLQILEMIIRACHQLEVDKTTTQIVEENDDSNNMEFDGNFEEKKNTSFHDINVSAISNDIFNFIRRYSIILLLPFPNGKSRLSLHQMTLLQSTLSFIGECNRSLPQWKIMMPELHTSFVSKTLIAVALWSSLLGDRDVTYELSQLRVLHGSFVAIGKGAKDKRSLGGGDENNNKDEMTPKKRGPAQSDTTPKLPNKTVSFSKFSEVKHFFPSPPSTDTKDSSSSNHPTSKLHIALLPPSTQTVSHREELENANKSLKNKSILVTLAEYMTSIINTLGPALAYLRNEISYDVLSSAAYQLDTTMNHHQYSAMRDQHTSSILLPVGSRIYYQSNIKYNELFTIGVVHLADPVTMSYCIRLEDGTYENNVPHTARAFSIPPLFPLIAKQELSISYLEFRSTKSIFSFDISMFPMMDIASTGHLVRLLKYCISWNKMDMYPLHYVQRENEKEESDGDLKLLSTSPLADVICGQLVWLLLVTLAHHSTSGVNMEYIRGHIEDIWSIISRKDFRNSNKSVNHWINNETWDNIRAWVRKMALRIGSGIEMDESPIKEKMNDVTQNEKFTSNTLALRQKSPWGDGTLRKGVQFLSE